MSAATPSLSSGGASLPRATLHQLAETLRQAHVSVTCHGNETSTVLGMTVDSREVEAGNLFVCKGAAFNPIYLTSAAEAGAAAYLCSESDYDELAAAAPHLPCLAVSDVRRAMALVAPEVYGHPERGLRIVGITGTKGKSTTAYMLRSIFEAAGAAAKADGAASAGAATTAAKPKRELTPEQQARVEAARKAAAAKKAAKAAAEAAGETAAEAEPAAEGAAE